MSGLRRANLKPRQWVSLYRDIRAKEQNHRCFYCHERMTPETVTADHIVPRSAWGSNAKDNVVAACRPCNVAKGSLPAPTFLQWLAQPPPGAPWAIWMAWSRRRVELRTILAKRRIMNSVGKEV